MSHNLIYVSLLFAFVMQSKIFTDSNEEYRPVYVS